MRRYNHIIWDWNGTLFNDTWLCLEIMNQQLEAIGKPRISYARYQEIFDFPVKNYYETMGFDFSKEPYESVAHRFIEEYTRRRFECSLHYGVHALLEKFRDFGCGHSVLSAYAGDELVRMLDRYGVRSFFTHVIGLDNHYASGKVDEGKLLLARLSMPISEVILIGDTVHDFQVAQEMGIDCILVANGHNSSDRLARCNAPVVSSLSEAMLTILP